MMRRRSMHCLLAPALLLGCMNGQGSVTYEAADAALYEAHVQPYVTVACGALHCHGAGGRPLRIYSELGLRNDDLLRPVPIDSANPAQAVTAEELRENVLAFSTVAPLSDGRDHFALRKPLRGDVAHIGGKLWGDTQAPGYLCLLAWLAPAEADGVDLPAVCAVARQALSGP